MNENMSTINYFMHFTIDTKMEYMEQDINAHIDLQLESFVANITELLNILRVLTSYEQPSNPEDIASSNSHIFKSNPLHCDPYLPRVENNRITHHVQNVSVENNSKIYKLHNKSLKNKRTSST